VTFDEGRGEIRIRVHNVGAATAPATTVKVSTMTSTESSALPAIEAPLDLVPRSVSVTLPFTPPWAPGIFVEVVPVADEITTENNRVAVWSTEGDLELPAPMITKVLATEGVAGDIIDVHGKNFAEPLRALVSEQSTNAFRVWLEEPGLAVLQITTQEPGTYLVSIRNPDGKSSNLVPITVR
jgi:hypothetical protein